MLKLQPKIVPHRLGLTITASTRRQCFSPSASRVVDLQPGAFRQPYHETDIALALVVTLLRKHDHRSSSLRSCRRSGLNVRGA